MAYIILPEPLQRIGEDMMPLSQQNPLQVITSEELKAAWTSTSGSTLVFFVNPKIHDRTGQSGNEYASVVQIGSSQAFKILVAPDAGRGFSMAPALFSIDILKAAPEIIEIPNFPLQRWTCVAIVKQGRKFNIYLNGKIAISHMCDTMPEFNTTQPLKIGDPRLGGNIALMSISPKALEAKEVRELYRSSVDGSGKPVEPIKVTNMFKGFMPSLPAGFWCPGGNCSSAFSTQGISPLEQWSSPYG